MLMKRQLICEELVLKKKSAIFMDVVTLRFMASLTALDRIGRKLGKTLMYSFHNRRFNGPRPFFHESWVAHGAILS